MAAYRNGSPMSQPAKQPTAPNAPNNSRNQNANTKLGSVKPSVLENVTM